MFSFYVATNESYTFQQPVYIKVRGKLYQEIWHIHIYIYSTYDPDSKKSWEVVLNINKN